MTIMIFCTRIDNPQMNLFFFGNRIQKFEEYSRKCSECNTRYDVYCISRVSLAKRCSRKNVLLSDILNICSPFWAIESCATKYWHNTFYIYLDYFWVRLSINIVTNDANILQFRRATLMKFSTWNKWRRWNKCPDVNRKLFDLGSHFDLFRD